jgi:hypothetical protein
MKGSIERVLVWFVPLLVLCALVAAGCPGTNTTTNSLPSAQPPPTPATNAVATPAPLSPPSNAGGQPSTPSGTEKTSIQIETIDDKPAGGGSVPAVPEVCAVAGTVKGLHGDEQVWVVVNPINAGEYWAQPVADVTGDKWTASGCHFGRPGMDSGVRFKVWAVVRSTPLEAGQLSGKSWRAGTLSEPVTCTRE